MAKQIIPEELEVLLQEYLTDGVITAKERQVLLRKAEKVGIDTDEFDLYIDAQEQKVQQAADAAARKRKGQTCPFCGGSVPMFADKCPHCGRHITAEANEEIKEIIENLENALFDLKGGEEIEKSKATVERYARKAELYYSNNQKIQKLLADIATETRLAEKQVKSKNTKYNIVSALTKNKWLTGIIIIVSIAVFCFAPLWISCTLIIILACIIWAISQKKPDPKHDPQVCIDAISRALANDDVVKAEYLMIGFNSWGSDISIGICKIIDYYIKKGNLEKACDLTKRLTGSDWEMYTNKLQSEYWKLGDFEKYEELEIYLDIDEIEKYNIPFYSKLVTEMKKTGKPNAEIKAFIKQRASGCVDAETKKSFESTLYDLIED